MICVGIDPGLHGGMAFIYDGLKATAYPLPIMASTGKSKHELDAKALWSMLDCEQACHPISLVCIEKEHAFPGGGVSSSFNFGVTCGKIKAILEILGLPTIEALPMTWKKVILKDTSKDKQVAIAWCKQRYPGVDLHQGRVKAHDGMSDALALAEYARQKLIGAE